MSLDTPPSAPFQGWRLINSSLVRNHFALPVLGGLVVLFAIGVTVYIDHIHQVAWAFPVALALVVVGLFFVGLIVLRIHQQMLQPLGAMRSWSQRIRAGDLETHIPLPVQGEFADLISDINSLTDELHVLTEEMDSKVKAQTEHIANKSRSLEILYDMATSLSTARNLDDLLEQFLDTLMTLVDASAASVRLLSDEGNTRLVASRGLSAEIIEQENVVDVNRCLCGRIARRGGFGIQKGVQECNRFLTTAIVDGDCSELVVVPLQYRDRILGVYNLFLDRPTAELGKDARDLLNSIGKHLGLALEKARLDENARRLAIMEERNMLGNELHDSLAQSLVSMRLQVKMLGELLYKKDLRAAQLEVRQLRSAVDEAHVSLRELLANFRSRMNERGLIPAIEELVQRFKDETGVHTFFQNDSRNSELSISPAQEVQVYRIVQEALSNIRKHSSACNVRVRFSYNGNVCSILVEDDGLGMDEIPDPEHPGEHIGLSIMRERAERIQGDLSIESEPGEGTRVYLSFSPTRPDHQGQHVVGE